MSPLKTKPILIVDDEPILLQIVKSILEQKSYTVYTALSAEEGLGILANKNVALVISDYKMPGYNGIDFLEKVKNDYPDVVRIIMTAYADVKVAIEAINRASVFRFLEKPWDQEEFHSSVQFAMECYGSREYMN